MRPHVGLTLSVMLVTESRFAAASNLWPIGKSNTFLKSKLPLGVDHTAGVTRVNRKSVMPDDYVGLITAPCGAKSKEHVKAMEILESLQSAPTCNKLATSSLLSSCQSIEISTPDQGSLLEGIKATYAAQLALCELRNVGAEPPEQCSLMAFDDGTPNIDLHSAELRACLRSLESRPQWWTSYSNNIQNAVVMCRAARVEIEKGESDRDQEKEFKLTFIQDEMINTMKVMLSTSSKAEEALENVLQVAKQELEQQRSFASAVHAFQEQLVHDLETASQKGQDLISTLTTSLGASLHSMLKALASASENIQINMNDLSHVSIFTHYLIQC